MTHTRAMEEVHKRLRSARERAGYASAREAADSMGVKYPTYAGHENGTTGLRPLVAERYARKFKVDLNWLLTGRGQMTSNGVEPYPLDVAGLPILGSIQAGHWLETSSIQHDGEHEMLPAARDPRFPNATQYALQVIGDSMDLHYPNGSYVTCVDYAESGLAIKDGMIVHVERQKAGGQFVEITLKRVERRNGDIYLVPKSTNPRWEAYPLSNGKEDEEVLIKGVVTGGWARAEW